MKRKESAQETQAVTKKKKYDLEKEHHYLELIKNDSIAPSMIPPDLLRSEDFLKNALKLNGMILEHVHKKDLTEDLIMMALNQNGLAIQFLPKAIRHEDKYVKVAILSNPTCLSEGKIRGVANDLEYINLALVHKNWNGYKRMYSFSSIIKGTYLRHNIAGVCDFPIDSRTKGDVLKNKELAMKAVRIDPSCLQYFNQTIKKDKDVVLEAIKGNGIVLYYANKMYLEDIDLIMIAMKTYHDAIDFIPAKTKHYSFSTYALEINGNYLKYIDTSILDKYLCILSLKNGLKQSTQIPLDIGTPLFWHMAVTWYNYDINLVPDPEAITQLISDVGMNFIKKDRIENLNNIYFNFK